MTQHPIDYTCLATEYAQHRRVHPQVLKSLIETGPIDGATRVLEVGCGTGNYSLALVEATGCQSYGIDPSPAMLAQAENRSPEATFQLGHAEKLDFPDSYFDVVFSVDVIHHVRDRAAFYREARRVLKPGGGFCTVTDTEAIIRSRQPLAVYWPETIAPELERYPSLATLQSLLAEAGFEQITTSEVEFAYPITDLQAYRDKAFSALHLIPKTAFQRGIQKMTQDLATGPIEGRSRYILLWGR